MSTPIERLRQRGATREAGTMTTEEKIRWLAEQAGWRFSGWPNDGCLGHYRWFGPDGQIEVRGPDYPHSLDAIERDLLPLLREKGWAHELDWDTDGYDFFVWTHKEAGICRSHPDFPATAAFEAIFEALHGATE